MTKEIDDYKNLKFSFFLSIGCYFFGFAILALTELFQQKIIAILSGIWVLIWLYSSVSFWIYLWKMAKNIEKSPINWAGGAYLTFPIGPIVAYVRMTAIAEEKGWKEKSKKYDRDY